jgi:hypothetical protein
MADQAVLCPLRLMKCKSSDITSLQPPRTTSVCFAPHLPTHFVLHVIALLYSIVIVFPLLSCSTLYTLSTCYLITRVWVFLYYLSVSAHLFLICTNQRSIVCKPRELCVQFIRLFNDAVSSSHYIASSDEWFVNNARKLNGRKRSWPNLKCLQLWVWRLQPSEVKYTDVSEVRTYSTYLEGLRRRTRNVSQGSQCPCRDSNPNTKRRLYPLNCDSRLFMLRHTFVQEFRHGSKIEPSPRTLQIRYYSVNHTHEQFVFLFKETLRLLSHVVHSWWCSRHLVRNIWVTLLYPRPGYRPPFCGDVAIWART